MKHFAPSYPVVLSVCLIQFSILFISISNILYMQKRVRGNERKITTEFCCSKQFTRFLWPLWLRHLFLDSLLRGRTKTHLHNPQQCRNQVVAAPYLWLHLLIKSVLFAFIPTDIEIDQSITEIGHSKRELDFAEAQPELNPSLLLASLSPSFCDSSIHFRFHLSSIALPASLIPEAFSSFLRVDLWWETRT